jgi:hypothetical protein
MEAVAPCWLCLAGSRLLALKQDHATFRVVSIRELAVTVANGDRPNVLGFLTGPL